MIKKDILEIIVKSCQKNDFKIDDFNFVIEEPKNKNFGDYAINVMGLAKKLKTNPFEIAQKIEKYINDYQKDIIAEAVMPGFINFKLSNNFLNLKLKDILSDNIKKQLASLGKNRKINLEFISANPTGPLHLGNGRGGFCGDTLANVFSYCSAEVKREYYINDCGLQVENLGHSILGDEQAVYDGEYIKNLRKIAPRENDFYKIGEWAAKEILENSIKKTIKKMGIKFDKYFSEQEMYDRGEVDKTVDFLQKNNFTETQDGAVWFKSTEFNDEKDRVLKRANGKYTYFASDIAYHKDKIERGFDLCINFWGADHAGYVPRITAAVNTILKESLSWTGQLKIIIFQMVRVLKDGKELRMSKRAGNIITMDEILDIAGLDATRFFFIANSYNTHINFDLDLAKKKSKENPVYYIQYAYARISSIFKKTQNSKLKTQNNRNLEFLREKEELNLAKQLIKFPDMVKDVFDDQQVHRIAFYALNLADAFHIFYEKCRILELPDKDLANARINLCQATQIILKNTLDLMGISSPKEM